MATLYLRPSEWELLEKLPSALAGACAVEDEELTSYESTVELVVRMRLVASDAHPEVRLSGSRAIFRVGGGGERCILVGDARWNSVSDLIAFFPERR